MGQSIWVILFRWIASTLHLAHDTQWDDPPKMTPEILRLKQKAEFSIWPIETSQCQWDIQWDAPWDVPFWASYVTASFQPIFDAFNTY